MTPKGVGTHRLKTPVLDEYLWATNGFRVGGGRKISETAIQSQVISPKHMYIQVTLNGLDGFVCVCVCIIIKEES